MPADAFSPAAERQRRLRLRRKLDLLIATAEVPLELAEHLVEAGLLREEDATDPRCLGAALTVAGQRWWASSCLVDGSKAVGK